jgi:LmbE family N-acetylglucosaminyl deacetylase
MIELRKVKKRYVYAIWLIIAFIIIFGLISLLFAREYAVLPQSAYYLLSEISAPTNHDKVLVLSPHPDDETLGAGGLIERSIENGASVEVVIVTDGNKHGLKDVRHDETLKAMADLGLNKKDIVFLNYKDGEMAKNKVDFLNKLKPLITSFVPTIIVSTDSADIHPDHATVGEDLDEAIREISLHPKVYQFIVHYHRYPRPTGFYPQSYLLPPARLVTINHPWQKLSLTTEEQDRKNEAVLQYKSQLSHKNPFLRGLLLSFIRENELFRIVQK